MQSFKPDSWWFQRWQEDYGLSLRQANRKYAVPRHVLKQRLELFWVSLFTIRQLAVLALRYDPVQLNFDQSPYHHNESGSQNKATLGVRGSLVPVVEGNCDCKARWTANLTTCSDATAVAAGQFPPAECMFKGNRDGRVHLRLEEHRRVMGFPRWFTVSMSEKGSYKEHDVIAFLKRHLEEWKPGRDWRIIFADDYRAHKTENVWALCWSRGYVLIVHGGGATPVAQTPDTDLNEEVRRIYGNKESAVLMEKMRQGQTVPKLSQEECMDLMYSVISDKELHKKAAQGFKKVGQSIDLHGKEDNLIVREAATYWNERTTDGYANMREKLNAEMAEVAEDFAEGHIQWNEQYVRGLIRPYPRHKAVDKVLETIGDHFSHDAIHDLSDAEEEEAEADNGEAASCDSEDEKAAAADHEGDGADEDDCDDDEHETAVAAMCDDVPTVAADDKTCEDSAKGLCGEHAEALHRNKVQIAALQGSIEAIKLTGQIKVVQHMEREIATLRRRQRGLCSEFPAVADAFKRQRVAEEQEARDKMFAARQAKELRQSAQTAVAAKKAALAALAKAKRAHEDVERKQAQTAAFKTFSLDMLGGNSSNAGGAAARKNRFQVLDRVGTHLSPAQRNDFEWWKRAWDDAMVEQHKGKWAEIFAGWMQEIINKPESNAFSVFMHNETNRVLKEKVKNVLAVPGGN